MNLDQLKKNIIFNFQNMENLFVYYRLQCFIYCDRRRRKRNKGIKNELKIWSWTWQLLGCIPVSIALYLRLILILVWKKPYFLDIFTNPKIVLLFN